MNYVCHELCFSLQLSFESLITIIASCFGLSSRESVKLGKLETTDGHAVLKLGFHLKRSNAKRRGWQSCRGAEGHVVRALQVVQGRVVLRRGVWGRGCCQGILKKYVMEGKYEEQNQEGEAFNKANKT